MPVHGNERGCALRAPARDVLGADDLHHAAPAPHQPHQAQADRDQRFCSRSQTRASQAPAGAGLLFVDRVAKTAVGFFLHDALSGSASVRRNRLRYNARDADHWHIPPAPPKASISAAATNRWRACATISRDSATSIASSRPSRGVYNYVINHPDDIKRVLLSNHRNYTKGEGMDRVKILLGNGIMTSEGDFWRRQRRMMQPSFHRRVIDQFSALIREVNDKYRGALGRQGRARRAGQHHRRCQRTDPGDRAALDLRHRSCAPRAAIRRQSRSRSSPRNRTAI